MLINDSLTVVAQKSIDGKKFKLVGLQHVPYDNAADVLANIVSTRRHVGQEFAVVDGSDIAIWHFVGGFADVNLVKVVTSGGSSGGFIGRFKIGDGGADTPAAGSTSFVVTDLIGKTIDDFSIFRNGTAIWPIDEYTFDGSAGTISLAVAGDKLTNGQTILIL